MTRKGCLFSILIGCLLLIGVIYSIFTAFEPVNDKTEIKQQIGGTLICNSVYRADHYSWLYDVSYSYKINKDSLIDIGNGTYYEREWNKDEQLIKYGKWLILKTGDERSDKIIVGDLLSKNWTEYKFNPENIEESQLWHKSKTQSLLNWCCSESFIDKISDGQIVVNYKFRTSENQPNEYGYRKIYYTISEETGELKMTKVE